MRGRPSDLVAWLFEQPKDKVFEVTEYREKRSLSANGYYWKLVELITAERRKDDPNATKEEIHRALMRDYGAWEHEADGSPKWVILAENKPLPSEGYFSKPFAKVSVTGERGNIQTGLAYISVKGSHEYNSKEMYDLIQGAVQEAKQLDIETKTPQEIEELTRLLDEKPNITT